MTDPFYLIVAIQNFVFEFEFFHLHEVDGLGMSGENILHGVSILPRKLLLELFDFLVFLELQLVQVFVELSYLVHQSLILVVMLPHLERVLF